MPKLTITLDEAELKILEKRGKKNFLTTKEQAEDIIRRSCINYSKGAYKPIKVDDRLVAIFSRQKSGRKKKVKVKKISVEIKK